MQEARDGQLKIVDRATRDVHSVAWMLRRAVGRAGAERNAAGRRAQAFGAGSQEGHRTHAGGQTARRTAAQPWDEGWIVLGSCDGCCVVLG